MSIPGRKHLERDGFRLRGLESSRVDNFSDVVFGFALTLLVVSLEVPKSYTEMHHIFRGFLPFAICFLLLMMVWFSHYRFFRRFGLHDIGTIWLNGVLLFMVLFFVYPLKFLFTMVAAIFLGGEQPFQTAQQEVELMVLYGVGYAAIYLLFAALYWNGWRQREHLELNDLERVLTRGYIVENLGMCAVGVLSALVAMLLPEHNAGWAGMIYLLITPSRMLAGRHFRRRARLVRMQMEAANAPSESSEAT